MSSTIKRLDMLMCTFATALDSQTAFHCRLDDQGTVVVISSAGLIPLAQINDSSTQGFVDRAVRAGQPILEPLDPERDASLIASVAAAPLTHAVSAPVRAIAQQPEALIVAFVGPPPEPTAVLRTLESCAAMLAMCLAHPNGFETLIRAACYDQSLNGGQRHRAWGRARTVAIPLEHISRGQPALGTYSPITGGVKRHDAYGR